MCDPKLAKQLMDSPCSRTSPVSPRHADKPQVQKGRTLLNMHKLRIAIRTKGKLGLLPMRMFSSQSERRQFRKSRTYDSFPVFTSSEWLTSLKGGNSLTRKELFRNPIDHFLRYAQIMMKKEISHPDLFL